MQLLAAFGAIIIAALVLFLLIPLGTAIGYFTGWVIGYWFPSIFVPLMAWTGLSSPAQVGALLGFVGGFFKASSYNASASK